MTGLSSLLGGLGRPPRRSLLVLATLALLACRQEPAGAPDRIEGWRGDLEFLRAEVLAKHPAPPVDPDFSTFTAAVSTLSDEVPTLTDEAIVARIQRLLVGLGNGHTTIIPDDFGPVPFLALMVDFYWFDEGVYIASVRPGLGGLQGARVTAIGGIPIDEFRTRLAPLVPHDNDMSARWLGAQLMQYSAVVRAVGGTATDAATPLDVVLPTGASQSVNVASHARGAMQRLFPPGGVSAQTPWYLRDREAAFWLDSLPADSTLYVAFQSVRDETTETLAAFAQRVRTLLLSGRFRSVLVETRTNNGGNGFLLPPLLSAFEAFDDASPGNRIITIIGRGSFSAGQNFVTQLEQRTRATFVGEPTGSRPNHIGDQSDTPLPFSQLRVSIASRWHVDADPTDDRPWIAPSVTIPVRADDYFANRDPAFDAALALIRSRP